MDWGTVPAWLAAGGTLIVAAVAVFQETIRSCFYRPTLRVRVRSEPPDCVKIPFIRDGQVVADTIHLRVWVWNEGNATARNVEVYAESLTRRRADGTWETVTTFPPMNLVWANLPPSRPGLTGEMYFPSISPEMGKHCDVAHITDPQRRADAGEYNPALGLTPQQVSLAFNLIVRPSNFAHIVEPGTYRLAVRIAAENARPVPRVIEITVPGPWYADEGRMLRDGVGISVLT